jgi:PAS domain-containing protein
VANQSADQETWASLTAPDRRLLPSRFLIQWLLLGGALLALGGFVAFSLLQQRSLVESQERERLTMLTRLADDALTRELEAVAQALAGVRAELPQWSATADGDERRAHQLRLLSEALPGVRALTLVDAQGTVIGSSQEALLGQNLRQRKDFQLARQRRDRELLYVSTPFRTPLGVAALGLSRVVLTPQGDFAGVVAATLEPQHIYQLLASLRYAPELQVALAHEDGQLLLAVPPQQELARLELTQPDSFFLRHLASRQPDSVLTGSLSAAGREQLIRVRTIAPTRLPRDKALVLIITRDRALLFAAWRRGAYGQGLLLAALALSAALGLAAYQRRQRIADSLLAARHEEQQQQVERLRLATKAAGVGVWDLQLRSGRLTWDDGMFSLFGADRPESGSPWQLWSDSVLPDDRERVRAAMQASIEQGQLYTMTIPILRQDAEVRMLHSVALVQNDVTGRPWRLIGTTEDITERRKSEQALYDAERFLRTLTGVIPGMVSHWTTELRCTFANQEYLTWFGKHPEELLGTRLQDLLGEELFRQNEPLILGALGGKAQQFQRSLTKPSGEKGRLWVHYIPDSDGSETCGMFVMGLDVTELHKAQRQLEQLNADLKLRTEQAETASLAKSQFLANMSHTVRTERNRLSNDPRPAPICDRCGPRSSAAGRYDPAVRGSSSSSMGTVITKMTSSLNSRSPDASTAW